MTLNKPSGNMYSWCYTTNPLGGKCKHECNYCYVDKFRGWIKKYQGAPYLDERWFKTKLEVPEGYIIFVQSCGDLFGEWIPARWIRRILDRLRQFPQTIFLLQSKNPRRFFDFDIPKNCILGTTIETNRDYPITLAPSPKDRFLAMKALPTSRDGMVSIEPIMDFDLSTFLIWMGILRPKFVSIGADSGNNHLPEPSPVKLKQLLWQLGLITEVRKKKNLERLLVQKIEVKT